MPLHTSPRGAQSDSFEDSLKVIFHRALMLKRIDEIKDGDGDGVIYDGTPEEQPVSTEQRPEQKQPQQPKNPQQAQPKQQPSQRQQPAAQGAQQQLDAITKSDRLFKEEELKLGRGAKQPAKSQAELYAQARECMQTFSLALDHGQGVDQAIGGKSLYPESSEQFNQAIDQAIQSKTPLVIIGKLKGEKRAAEKVEAKYGGDWGKLRDVVRATVAVPSAQKIPEAITALREQMAKKGWTLAESPDNRMENPLDTGYRDLQMLWKGPNGHLAELQINTLEMIKAKQGLGHKIYEDYRVVAETITKQGRKPTEQEAARLTSMRNDMKKLYDAAWR
jgi:hypothetical protein